MKIVVDGRMWSETGIGRYIRNLVGNLQEIDGSNEYYILLLKKNYNSLLFSKENFHKVSADFPWYGLSEQIKLPRLLSSLKPNLVHFPHFNIPITFGGKYVVTIHDLIHQHFATRESTTKNHLTFAVKKYGYRKVFSSAVKESKKIFVPSNFVKKQLEDEWKIDEQKIIVTYEGIDERIISLMRRYKKDGFKQIEKKFKIACPFLLYVGNAQPHKNILGLVKVFAKLKKNYPDLSLVLSGPEHQFWGKIREGLGGREELEGKDIIFTGFVSEEELVSLYKSAQAFILPSLEEGFGLPILEAMACGCPVVCSNAGSLPEIGGEAAVYFDPKDEQDMETKIMKVLKDEKLRKRLISLGLTRSKQFSWRKMAEQTLKIYQECV